MISGIALPLFISKYSTRPFPSILIISYLSTALVLVLPCWLKNAIRQILFSFLAHQILSTSIIHLCSHLYIMLLNRINFSLISYNNEYINLKCFDHHLHQADQESKKQSRLLPPRGPFAPAIFHLAFSTSQVPQPTD